MQEDEGLFDALNLAGLPAYGGAGRHSVKRPRCQEAAQQVYANATELAGYLVANRSAGAAPALRW